MSRPFWNFFLLHPHENHSKVLGYQGWDEFLMITLVSSQNPSTPNISAPSAVYDCERYINHVTILLFFNIASFYQFISLFCFVSRLNINVPWLSPFESKWDIELSGLHLLVVPSSSVQYDEEKEKEIEFQVSLFI